MNKIFKPYFAVIEIIFEFQQISEHKCNVFAQEYWVGLGNPVQLENKVSVHPISCAFEFIIATKLSSFPANFSERATQLSFAEQTTMLFISWSTLYWQPLARNTCEPPTAWRIFACRNIFVKRKLTVIYRLQGKSQSHNFTHTCYRQSFKFVLLIDTFSRIKIYKICWFTVNCQIISFFSISKPEAPAPHATSPMEHNSDMIFSYNYYVKN